MAEVGKLYTVSVCAQTGDRSYINSLWRVLAVNPTHLLVTSLKGEYLPDGYWHGVPHLIDAFSRTLHEADEAMMTCLTENYQRVAEDRRQAAEKHRQNKDLQKEVLYG